MFALLIQNRSGENSIARIAVLLISWVVLPLAGCAEVPPTSNTNVPTAPSDKITNAPDTSDPSANTETAQTANTDSATQEHATANSNETQESASDATDAVAGSKLNALDDFEQYVILNKGTERAFRGKYTDTKDKGTYICRQCNAPLYKSEHKFHSGCGWPAFDDEIPGAVERQPDGDRVEIICRNCQGHLGHVFHDEGFTDKNIRHCVNSVSMTLIPEGKKLPPMIRIDE